MNNTDEAVDTKDKKTRAQIGSKRLLKVKLWAGVLKAHVLLESEDPQLALKAVNSLATIGGVYQKMLFSEELEGRLFALEESLKGKS
jgi:hypothetical protein